MEKRQRGESWQVSNCVEEEKKLLIKFAARQYRESVEVQFVLDLVSLLPCKSLRKPFPECRYGGSTKESSGKGFKIPNYPSSQTYHKRRKCCFLNMGHILHMELPSPISQRLYELKISPIQRDQQRSFIFLPGCDKEALEIWNCLPECFCFNLTL